jgi:hypothetical protein
MSCSYRLIASAAVSILLGGCTNHSSDDAQNTLEQILAVKAQVLKQTDTPQAFQAADLLTDEDIREIMGYSVIKKTPGPAHGIFQNGCEWELDSGAGANWSITLGVMSPGGRRYFDTYLNLDNLPPIPALGDIAISSMSDCITAVKGDVLVDLQYIEFTKSKPDIARRLIERIFSRIP